MKEYDVVEVIAEKEKYAKKGVHAGMRGRIMMPQKIGGAWFVIFSGEVKQIGQLAVFQDIECIIKAEDLKLIETE